MLPILGGDPPPSTVTEHTGPAPVCSAKSCGRAAHWTLHWNNPKIHHADRRKTWLACEQHRQSLAEFLTRRGLLRETTTIPAP